MADLNHFLVRQRRSGLRWLDIAGTTLMLPEHPITRQQFGSSGSSHSPIARVSQLLDLSSRITIDVQVSPLSTGERTLAHQHFQHCQSGDLILADRGYAGAALRECCRWAGQGGECSEMTSPFQIRQHRTGRRQPAPFGGCRMISTRCRRLLT